MPDRRSIVLAAVLLGAPAGGCGGEVRPAHRAAQQAPAPETTTAPPATPRPARPRAVRLTIEVNGDLLIHRPVFDRALAVGGGRRYEFAPMLRLIRPWVRGADLAICHVETPMSGAARPSGYPRFNAPPSLARAIRATGWDACDTASNHSLDLGQPGIDATLRALDRAGVRHTGSASSRRGARRILLLRSHGVKVAYLAYTTITNGLPRPHPWSLSLARATTILRDARRARRAGARVVLVNLHWGTEYRHSPDAAQLDLARRLTRSPSITAIVGQHVHVVQPIRRLHGRWVVFGEGNLLSNQTGACCAAAAQDGMLVLVHVVVRGARSRVERVDYVPTWVRHPDFTVLPVGEALRRGLAPAPELRASWNRTVGVVGRGAHLRPVTRRRGR